eukprot:CAMPEP_0202906914 /NCGR_PEP_ID=MMETSP1392-20130828/40694_1 /ASSEMBLY_ACC=CAM_ASM_000868 /TAXON_ID=225041 /ORGANISM="Chlamydomonas chlamydogama, Strain SAG 11-48b" /LENGTH=400 /DNA_ID=CAMNT_0049595601 /DNA_START=285 /DNA_END=1488 /DNA_ORIENTATION=+
MVTAPAAAGSSAPCTAMQLVLQVWHEVQLPDFRDYTALHWGIEFGTQPARYLVSEDVDGLADRVVNAVAAFYIALITRRALCLRPAERHQPPLEDAFDAPFVDWACPGKFWDVPDQFTQMTYGDGDFRLTDSVMYREFVLADIRQLPGNNYTTWHLGIQRGLSVAIFHNLAHHEELHSLGLRPDTAFGCALAYLMRPNRQTMQLVPRPLMSAMTDERIIKIAIQIRTGDKIIKSGGNVNATAGSISKAAFTRLAEPFFTCAQALEDDLVLRTGAKKVLWYLMTDMVAIRFKAEERYGPKLLVFNETEVALFRKVSAHQLQLLVMEHWLFQQAHYHIITEKSGVGRTAAFASLRHDNVFTMSLPQNNFAGNGPPTTRVANRGCKLHDYDSVFDVHDKWSGV